MRVPRARALLGIALLLSLAIVVVGPGRASATTVSGVSDETEYRAALATLSADVGGGPHVIEIDADFTITDPGGDGDPTYSGPGDLEIHGNGHTVDSGVADVRFFYTISPVLVTIDGLTVDGFTVSATSGEVDGGAVYVGDDIDINDSTFTNNSVSVSHTGFDASAVAAGGAVYVDTGTLSVTGSTFTGNSATASADGDDAAGSATVTAYGGAIASPFSPINIDDSTFTGNLASGTGDGWDGEVEVAGGAVYSGDGLIQVGVFAPSEFSSNTAHGDLTAYRDDEQNTVDVQGGAIAGDTQDVEVYDSLFDSNAVTGDITGPDDYVENTGQGGAIFTNEDVVADTTTFTGNSVTTTGDDAAAWGGAIEGWGEDPGVTVSDSTFTGNSVSATADSTAETADAYGGAIEGYGDLGGVFVSGSTFTDNAVFSTGADDAEGYAGAISVDYGLTIDTSTFSGNSVTTNAGGDALGVGGVAVFYQDGDIEITDSEFSGNTVAATGVGEADAGGGVIAEDPDGGAANSFVADGDTFTGNGTYAEGDDVLADGGAIFALDTEVTVANSTLQGNGVDGDGDSSAYLSGGAISVYYGDLYVDFTTFSDNEAEDGGHIYTDSSTLYPYASVFVDPVAAEGCDLDSLTSVGFNFDDDGTCSDSDLALNDDYGFGEASPLESLAKNGGPTRTMRPTSGGSLIDYIAPGDCSFGSDQRGLARPTGTGCEPGAVEALADLTFDVVTDAGTIHGTVENADCVENIDWSSATGYLPTPPAGVSFPFGFAEYSFCVPAAGWTVQVTLDLPSPVNQVWKTDGSDWTQVTPVAIAGTTVGYSVTDGDALDADGAEDAYIVDPVGPGIGAAFTG